MSEQTALKIIELKATNVLNLKAIELKPDLKTVILTGKNESGKSAILNAIFMALTGKSVEKPIREGEEKAEVEINVGRFHIKKIWTDKTTRLEVYKIDEDGNKSSYGSPQKLLNEIIGSLAFDPLEFKNKDKKAQRDLLAKVVGLDLSDLVQKSTEIYEERKAKNKEITKLEALFEVRAKPAEGLPVEEVSIKSLLQELEELEKEKSAYQKHIEGVENLKQTQEILKDSIKLAEEDLRILKNEAADITKELEILIEPESVSEGDIYAIKTRISNAESKNDAIRDAIEYRKAEDELMVERSNSDSMDEIMLGFEKEKTKRIKACKYPIPGLTIDDESVYYNGKPFSQESSSRQIRISTAIAMALNPKLKVIMVRDGSLLDDESMKEILELTGGKDYQLWIERVDSSGKVGVFIEDGGIKSINGKNI